MVNGGLGVSLYNVCLHKMSIVQVQLLNILKSFLMDMGSTFCKANFSTRAKACCLMASWRYGGRYGMGLSGELIVLILRTFKLGYHLWEHHLDGSRFVLLGGICKQLGYCKANHQCVRSRFVRILDWVILDFLCSPMEPRTLPWPLQPSNHWLSKHMVTTVFSSSTGRVEISSWVMAQRW